MKRITRFSGGISSPQIPGTGKVSIVGLLFQVLLLPSLWGQVYPPFTATVFDTTSSGYYFVVPIKIGPGPALYNPTHLILDRNGNVVYVNEFVSGNNTGDFKLQPNGLISYSFANKFYLMDSTFAVVDSVRCKNGIIQDGHDMQVLPNGHFLLMGLENVVMDLSAYHLFNNSGDPGNTNAIVRCGVIQEQDANKNVVFEWHSKDHFSFADVDSVWLTNPANVDWTHFNAVELDTDGNILISSRHFNEITKINHTTGAVMWRLGGNANQFTFTNDPAMFKAQHDIRRIANGNITLLDNGSSGPPFHPAAANEYQLDEVNLVADLIWENVKSPALFSGAIGNVQRLPNGNTLANYGLVDNLNQAFEVVNPSGEKVFELVFTDFLRTYRAFNYPDLPWDLHRPVISCTLVDGQYFLDAGSGHSNYLWSTGATTQMVPAVPGSYFVFVPRGTGGFISSESFVVTDLSNPCGISAVEVPEGAGDGFSLYPNPVDENLVLDLPHASNPFLVIDVFDVLGDLVYSSRSETNRQMIIPVSGLKSGVYYLRVNGVGKRFVKI